jgi:antitoxin PrlF
MNRIPRRPAAFSKASVKNRTAIPRGTREADTGLLDAATEAGDNPFALFSEWTSEADEKAYRGL